MFGCSGQNEPAMQSVDEIRTERLQLSRISTLDFENERTLHSNAQVMAMVGGVRSAEFTRSEVKKKLEHWVNHGFGIWMAREAISNHFVGAGGLFCARLEEIAEIEIGYLLMPEFWGRGFATELAHARAMRIGFLGL